MTKNSIKETSQGRKTPPLADARKIKDRLGKFREHFCGDKQNELAKSLRVSKSTVCGWFSNPPKSPDIKHLLTMGREKRINLDWLLLGRGPRLFKKTEGILEDVLHSALESQLIASGTLTASEAKSAMPSPKKVMEAASKAVTEIVKDNLLEIQRARSSVFGLIFREARRTGQNPEALMLEKALKENPWLAADMRGEYEPEGAENIDFSNSDAHWAQRDAEGEQE